MNLTSKIAMLLVSSGLLANAAPFTNGGFESPSSANTAFTFLPNGSTFVTGWTYTGSESNVGYTTGNAFSILAGQGISYITWGAFGQSGGALSQTFDTVAGTTYQINYLLTTQQDISIPTPVQSNSVQAFNGVNLLNGVSNTFNMPNGTWLNGVQLVFTAASGATTLIFTDTSATGAATNAINWGLDHVTLNALPSNGSNVPEPSTYALVLAALGGIALRVRKR